jgi:hypothetical protein
MFQAPKFNQTFNVVTGSRLSDQMATYFLLRQLLRHFIVLSEHVGSNCWLLDLGFNRRLCCQTVQLEARRIGSAPMSSFFLLLNIIWVSRYSTGSFLILHSSDLISFVVVLINSALFSLILALPLYYSKNGPGGGECDYKEALIYRPRIMRELRKFIRYLDWNIDCWVEKKENLDLGQFLTIQRTKVDHSSFCFSGNRNEYLSELLKVIESVSSWRDVKIKKAITLDFLESKFCQLSCCTFFKLIKRKIYIFECRVELPAPKPSGFDFWKSNGSPRGNGGVLKIQCT